MDPESLGAAFIAYGHARCSEMDALLDSTRVHGSQHMTAPRAAVQLAAYQKPGNQHVSLEGTLPSSTSAPRVRRGAASATTHDVHDPFQVLRHWLAVGTMTSEVEEVGDAQSAAGVAGLLEGPPTHTLPVFTSPTAASACLAAPPAGVTPGSAALPSAPDQWLPSPFAAHVLLDMSLSANVSRPKALLKPLVAVHPQ